MASIDIIPKAFNPFVHEELLAHPPATKMSPAYIDTTTLAVSIAFCKRRPSYDPLHWILITAHHGSDRGTWYHVVGGPSQRRGYELRIQANKRLDSPGIESKKWISNIPATEQLKVKAAVKAVPLQYHQCWMTLVLSKLHFKGLVPLQAVAEVQRLIEPPFYQALAKHERMGSKYSKNKHILPQENICARLLRERDCPYQPL
ncbi:uncharacterized protein N7459_009323 [Penicillium hispanicum]|uniref:uncharacterized protein n=1 Tax=Penicillium hispanicum TaxID=1080232 RepID=UPI0025404CB4|nr:uncharacterized protein N7459_009323 [Penicillium hispanicum]KAJ5569893.1 hypothetical protein N7459_009323 [Penicillium hispanicum]